MDAQATEGLLRFFRTVPDPRAANAWHRLDDLLAISILAVLCGADGWAACSRCSTRFRSRSAS